MNQKQIFKWKPINQEYKKGKADLTNWEIFTIDGDDTKDIDDAISLYEDKDGNTVLGVHIAYPAYYIKKDNQSKAKKTFWQSLGSFLKKYIWIIIFPIIVGGILVVINIIIRKKRKV